MNCCCWWCCHQIETTILPLPIEYNPGKDTFVTMGQFCSWSCSKAFTLDRFRSIHKMSDICSLITLFRKKTEGKLTPVKPAPNRYILNMFGGPMSIEEFRKECHMPTVEYQFPDTRHAIPIVVKKIQEAPEAKKGDLERRLDNIHRSSHKNEPLKLRRTKPLKRNIQANSLEQSLDIRFS